jgi:hypothetical protein
MLGIWRRKAVECACEAPRNAGYEWKPWDGWYVKARSPDALPPEARPAHDAEDGLRLLSATVRRFTLPSAEASPDGDCEEPLIVKSGFNHGGRSERWFSRGQRKLPGVGKPGRAIRRAFDYKAAPRRMKKLAHRSGCTGFFLRIGERRDELTAALLTTACRFAEGEQRDYFASGANSTPGMGHAIENRMAFPREPWDRDPQ